MNDNLKLLPWYCQHLYLWQKALQNARPTWHKLHWWNYQFPLKILQTFLPPWLQWWCWLRSRKTHASSCHYLQVAENWSKAYEGLFDATFCFLLNLNKLVSMRNRRIVDPDWRKRLQNRKALFVRKIVLGQFYLFLLTWIDANLIGISEVWLTKPHGTK